jgi:hypothetical protein
VTTATNASIKTHIDGVVRCTPNDLRKFPRKIGNDNATATPVHRYALIIAQPARAPANGPKPRPI